MNGIGLLVLISVFGQVAAPTSPAPPSASQGDERDFGWQISPEDGALEYIVQISPQVVQVLQLSKDQFASHMPPALVGRATRVVVQVGSGVLPREPSLKELENYPRFNSSADLQAALGRGGFSDIEAESLKNVQGGGLPPLPGLSSAGSLSDAADNVIDRAANATANLPASGGSIAQQLRNDFLNSARNSPPPIPGNLDAEARNPASPQQSSLGLGGSKFNSTAPPPVTDAPAGLVGGNANVSGTAVPPLAAPPSVSDWGTSTPPLADYRPAPGFSEPALRSPATDPRALEPQYAPPARDDLPMGIAQRGQMPGRSLSEQLGQDRYSFDARDPRGGSQDGYANYRNHSNLDRDAYEYSNQRDPLGAGGYEGASNRGSALSKLASRETLPATTPKNIAEEEESPGDNSSTSGAETPKTNDNLWQLFFLLSLVMNLYLGRLIHKLLLRYRSLLANVRSQTA